MKASVQSSRVVQGVSQYVFFGWVIVAIGFIAQIFTSLSVQGLSTYMSLLNRDRGWSATATAAGRSLQQADSFLGPLSGWLVDRFGAHKLMSVGVVIYVAAFVLVS